MHITSNSIGTMTVALLKPDGPTLTSSTSSGSFDLAMQTLPMTGTYKIKVNPSGWLPQVPTEEFLETELKLVERDPIYRNPSPNNRAQGAPGQKRR